MKRLLAFAVLALVVAACGNNEPSELYVPKGTVEFVGNGFASFSLGADVKLYTAPSPEKSSEWTVQAVVPVRKETENQLESLEVKMIPLDDRSIRVRDGLVLTGEDVQSLVPVYNAGKSVERTVVFSVAGGKKFFTKKEADEIIAKTKGVRMDFNAKEKVVEAEPVKAEEKVSGKVEKKEVKAPVEEKPRTVDALCRKYGVYGMLSQYEKHIQNKDKKAAKKVEDQLWAIEKKVKNDNSLPKDLRDSFKDYVEDKEDEIEARYK